MYLYVSVARFGFNMLSRLKRAIGPSIDEEEDDQDSADSEVVEYRLSYRSFVDDNGWETKATWKASEMDPWDDLPVTRQEVRARMGPDWPPGHYKLFPVDEHGRMRPAEWSITLGTEEEARLRKTVQEGRQSEGDQEDSEGGSVTITPEMWNEMQEIIANIDWSEEEER